MAKAQNYSYKTRRSDINVTRMMVVFALLVLSVFGLLYVKNWLLTPEAVNGYDTYLTVTKYLPILPILLSAGALIYFVTCRRNKKDEALKLFSSAFLLSVALVMLAVSLMISKYVYTGYIPSIILIVLVCVLYFIAVSFPGPYLMITVFNALGAFSIYALSLIPIDATLETVIFRTLAGAAALAFCGVLIYTKKNGGMFLGTRLLPEDASYLPLFIAPAVFVAFIILGAFIGSYVIYDLIIAIETIIFALFYAIKMLK